MILTLAREAKQLEVGNFHELVFAKDEIHGHFSCVDGVAYVERRVFGFWDLQHRNWYLVDTGVHCEKLRLRRAGV